MKLLKKAAALALACVIALGTTTSALADNGETSVIDVSDKNETSVIDADNSKTETEIITGEEKSDNSTNVDISDIDYTPIDLTDYEKWNGKTDMEKGKNYYIEGTVKITSIRTVPEGSRLVLTPGSSLLVYKGKTFRVKGSMIIEPKATLTTSGKMQFYKDSAVENYGTVKGTVSSVFNVMGEYINRNGAETLYSGAVNIYKNGIYINYGRTSITNSAKMLCTGDIQTPESGKLINKGYFAVTVSGRASFAGSFFLYGETVNSGVFIFEKTVKYYKSKSARLAVSDSSRLIDYRYTNPNYNYEDKEEDKEHNTDVGIKGIDVSYAQGAINWTKVKQAGIEFAMIRATYGKISDTRPMGQDSWFERNITEAAAVGIETGVYHYLYAGTVEEAIEEAKFFIKCIEPYKITYPVVLDIEEQFQADLGVEKVTEICKAFLDVVRDAGYYAMIYSNKSWLTYHLDVEQLKDYDVWLAQWYTVPTYEGDFGIWQYSNKGIVSGIDVYVDLNLAYKDYAKIIRKGGYNHLK